MPRAVRFVLSLAVLAAFGCASIALGQDANWDLRNYHLYNPWAFLDGRLATDLAPAGMPTYFNPLLDLPYAALAQVLPPRLLAFAMGAWHGTSLLLLYAVARAVLPEERDRLKVAALALVGCLGSAFLSELGNTMGDDTTAPFLLAALALVLHARGSTRPVRFAIAGLLAGAAIGLKLTNAPYGLALVLATFVVARPGGARLQRSVLIALGLAAGVALTFGWWGATMMARFGNPLFPQFNAIFGAPLAASTGIVDDKWFAATLVETLLFPFVFTIFPMRVHEIPLANPLWPVVYVLFVGWIAILATRALRRRALGSREPVVAFLLLFAAIAYGAWLITFSIGRYLIVLELLFPLLAWVLLHRLFRPSIARPVAWAVLASAVAMPFVHFTTWGNAPFADRPYRVDVPAIADPARATVLVLAAPVAWVLPSFPREVAFVSRNSGFPESSAYRATVRDVMKTRGGPVYALLPAETNEVASGLARLNAFLARHAVRDDDLSCRYVRAVLANAPASDVLFDGTAHGACRFRRDIDRNRMSGRDAETIVRAIAKDGIHLDLATCPTFRAWIGASPFDYRFCAVTRG